MTESQESLVRIDKFVFVNEHIKILLFPALVIQQTTQISFSETKSRNTQSASHTHVQTALISECNEEVLWIYFKRNIIALCIFSMSLC